MTNIKKSLMTALSASALAFGLQACSTVPTETASAAAFVPSGDAPALWKVADEDTTIYLFGTVHALPSDIPWNTGPVQEALASSGSLVTEIDMDPEKMAAIAPMMVQTASLTDGQTLRGLMTDDQKAAYEAGLGKIGVPPQAFDQFEPWFVAITAMQIILQQGGIDPSNGVENVLEGVVPEGTERVALETIEYQLGIFDELPMDRQIDYLLQVLEDPAAGVAMLDSIIDEWKTGDVSELGALLFTNAADDPVLMERLFYIRNANWAGWIDDRLDAPGTVFMAVGAGHLAGDKSVQAYLAERKISVTRIQ